MNLLAYFLILVLTLILLSKVFSHYPKDSYSPEVSPKISPKCFREKYINYPQFPTAKLGTGGTGSSKGFSKDLAKYLLSLSFNVELSNCSNLPIFPNPSDFNIHIPIEGKSPLGIPRMLAHFFHSDELSVTIIAFSGTWFLDEWAGDFDITQVAPTKLSSYQPGLMMAHKGIYEMYSTVQEKIHSLFKQYHAPTDKLYLTGHSLGGGTSTLCALDLYYANPVIYTFGSPRVLNIGGNVYFNNIITHSYRIFNTEDIFPDLPPPVGDEASTGPYEHVSNGYFFTENLGDVSDNHMLAYLRHFALLEKY